MAGFMAPVTVLPSTTPSRMVAAAKPHATAAWLSCVVRTQRSTSAGSRGWPAYNATSGTSLHNQTTVEPRLMWVAKPAT